MISLLLLSPYLLERLNQKKKTLLVFLITVHMDVHQPGLLS